MTAKLSPSRAARSVAKSGTGSGTPSKKTVGQQDVHPWGTQSIHRAITMLREIAVFHKGMRLVDVAAAMSLERPTAHRILKGLMSQGMVAQDPVTKYYRLGHVAYELGLAASPFFSLKEVCQPTLARMAEQTGDSVYLVVRSGLDGVCIDWLEGSYPIKTRTLDIGMRRPLGLGAASVALMLGLSDAEIERIIGINTPRMAAFGLISADRLREVIRESRAVGYAINDSDVLQGVSAIGAPIRPSGGQPYAAVSIAGIHSRFTEPRRTELAEVLRKTTHELAKKLDKMGTTWS